MNSKLVDDISAEFTNPILGHNVTGEGTQHNNIVNCNFKAVIFH